jgi:peptide/nickel transport system substrate-binding protein
MRHFRGLFGAFLALLLMHDKAMYAPIWELGFLNGVGPRVAESGLGLIPGHAYSAPYEDLRLAPK